MGLWFASLASVAWAGAPTATVTGEHTITGTVSVAAAPADVIARLADPVWVASADGGSTKVTIRAREGSCLVADYLSASAFLDVTYTVRQCPTANGYVSTLVTSNAFDSYRTEWKVEGEGTGSKLTYRLDLDSNLWVADSIVLSTARRGVQRLMDRMVAVFGAH